MSTVLLTATINPGDVSFVSLRDPAERLIDYEAALKDWASTAGVTGIVFCESSAYDLQPLKARAARWRRGAEIEFLSFAGQDFLPHLGKGYGEMGIVKYAFQHSALLQNSSHALKVTGRYRIRNAAHLVAALSGLRVGAATDLYRFLSYADSRVFYATRDFAEHHLFPLHQSINDAAGIYFEHVLARATHSLIASGGEWRPLPVHPRLAGRSGTTGARLDDGPWKHVSRSMRFAIRSWALSR